MREIFEPIPVNAAGARRVVAAELAEWGVASDTVLLVVSELVTNAVLHARSEFELTVSGTDRVVRVEVSDHNPELPVWPELPVSTTGAPDEACGGRGLALVRSLAKDWGVEAHPGDGKTVWCEVLL